MNVISAAISARPTSPPTTTPPIIAGEWLVVLSLLSLADAEGEDASVLEGSAREDSTPLLV